MFPPNAYGTVRAIVEESFDYGGTLDALARVNITVAVMYKKGFANPGHGWAVLAVTALASPTDLRRFAEVYATLRPHRKEDLATLLTLADDRGEST